MFLTSTGTMDKVNMDARKTMAEKANLVAAFRLPNNAFKTNAGTEVTTDLLILQKKSDGVKDLDGGFLKTGSIDGMPINANTQASVKTDDTAVVTSDKPRFVVNNGKAVFVSPDAGKAYTGKQAKRIKHFIGIRDAYNNEARFCAGTMRRDFAPAQSLRDDNAVYKASY